MAAPPQEGEKARDFTLPDASGDLVSLKKEWEKGPIILLFYPTDWGMNCSIEMKTFQAMLPELREKNVEVIGISTNTVTSHRAWKEQMGLTFRLLSDVDGEVSKLYGVLITSDTILRNQSNRAVFLINTNGIIEFSWVAEYADFQPDYDRVKQAVTSLSV